MRVLWMAAIGIALPNLASCSAEEPRAVTYFEGNENERQIVVAGCHSGELRGQECDNAHEAEKLVRRKERDEQNRNVIRSWNTIQ